MIKFNKIFKLNTKKETQQKEESYAIKRVNNIRDAVCCKNVNPLPDDHIQIINNTKIYARTLYIADLPRRSTFAYTFEPILKFPNANVSIFVKPMREGKAIKDLNNVIVDLDAERMMAENKDINRARRLTRLYQEAEALVDAVDAGENSLYDVSILITIHAKSYDELNKKTDDLVNKAKERKVLLSTPYAGQEEAFKANLPVNNNIVGYWHLMDKFSLATLFHFTQGKFGHSKGATLGRNLDTGELVSYNMFESKMNGYNLIICGMTRAGKSTTVKILALRSCSPNGIKFISLDPEGEYGLTAQRLGGINLEISNSSGIIINPFELELENKIDEVTGLEYPYLDLTEKISIATYNIMTMARGSDPDGDGAAEYVNEITRGIIRDTVKEAYKRKKIYHENNDSLFDIKDGKKVKKLLPTMSEWYDILTEKKFQDKFNTPTFLAPYEYLVMVMKDYTRKYEGTRLYFDGQSTYPNINQGISFLNFDIHHLNEKYERPIAQAILMDWMWEVRFKKNSENPLTAEQLVAFFDEAHHLLPYKEARKALTNFYRRAAKKNIAVLTATQNLMDYLAYDDAKAIFTNSATKILLRHDKQERTALLELMNVTEAEADAILTAEKGHAYIISGNNKAFVSIDRLPSEIPILETDMNVRKELAQQAMEQVSFNNSIQPIKAS